MYGIGIDWEYIVSHAVRCSYTTKGGITLDNLSKMPYDRFEIVIQQVRSLENQIKKSIENG